jgi:translation initiation factor 2B subunit (eIF-2B alpha/beta/delta family)
MKYIKWILGLITIVISVIAISDIVLYYNNPSSFMLGSEAMVSNGGISYKSEMMFLIINSIHFFVSLMALFFLFKSKHRYAIYIALLMLLFQVIVIILA